MKYCTFCGKQLPDEIQFCPYCMNKFVQETTIQTDDTLQNKSKYKKLLMVSALVALLIVGVILILLFVGKAENNQELEDTVNQTTTFQTTTEVTTAVEPSSEDETDVQSTDQQEIQNSTAGEVLNKNETDIQTPAQPVIQNPNITTTQHRKQNPNVTTTQRPPLTTAKNYSNYIGTWYAVKDTADSTHGQYAVTLNILYADTLNISGTLSVYHSELRETATINFNGELQKGLLSYDYDNDGIGNSGNIYIRLEGDEVRVSNMSIGWNYDALFHWNTDFTLTK